MKLYIDSNVLISLINHEFGRAFEYMEQAVQQFLEECAEKGHTLVLSELFFREVQKATGMPTEKALEYFGGIASIELVGYGQEEERAARSLAREKKTHFLDGLHAAIAIANRCDYFVTWNTKDFIAMAGTILPATPRDFI